MHKFKSLKQDKLDSSHRILLKYMFLNDLAPEKPFGYKMARLTALFKKYTKSQGANQN